MDISNKNDMEEKEPSNFNQWNEVKKNIHFNRNRKIFNEREVWGCSLGTNVGFEEDGKGYSGERPVLIIKSFSEKLLWMVPLSTSSKTNNYYISLGNTFAIENFAIISQLRLIDAKRLTHRVSYIPKNLFYLIQKSIKDLL